MDRRPDIDSLFADKLYNYEVAPPPSTWSGIKKALPQKAPFYKTPSFLITAAFTALLVGSWLNYANYNLLPKPHSKAATPIYFTTPNSHNTNNNTNNDNNNNNNINNDILNKKLPNSQDLKGNEQQLPAIDVAPNVDDNNQLPTIVQDQPLSQNNNKVDNDHYETASDKIIIPQKQNNIATGKPSKTQILPTLAQANTHIAAKTSQQQETTIQKDNNTALSKSTELQSIASTIAVQENERATAAITSPKTTTEQQTEILANKTTQTDLLQTSVLPITTRQTNLETQLAIIANPTLLNAQKQVAEQNTALSSTPKKPQHNGIGLSIQAFGLYGGSRIWSNTAESNVLHTPFGNSYSYGIGIGYDINPRIGIVAEYTAYTRQSQNVERIENGATVVSPIHLTYAAMPLLAKIRLLGSSNFNRPSELNVLIGMQYARLQSAAINSDNEQYLNLLKKDNWGFAAGLEYDHHLSRHLVATAGIRASLQMPANSTFDLQLPSNTSTNNLFVGGKMGLSWKF